MNPRKDWTSISDCGVLQLSTCHEPGATGSLAPAPVPLSPLPHCGLFSSPPPQPRSSSALRHFDRSPPYRAGSDIVPTHRPPAGLGPFSFVSVIGLARSSPMYAVSCLLCLRVFSPVRYVCCLPLIELARPSPMIVTSIVSP